MAIILSVNENVLGVIELPSVDDIVKVLFAKSRTSVKIVLQVYEYVKVDCVQEFITILAPLAHQQYNQNRGSIYQDVLLNVHNISLVQVHLVT